MCLGPGFVKCLVLFVLIPLKLCVDGESQLKLM